MKSKKENKAKVSEASHTPTPWNNDGRVIFQNTTNGLTKLRITEIQGHEDEAKADAEFIVRAVNSHEALLEVAKKLSETVFSDKTKIEDLFMEIVTLKRMARMAVIKAEKGE